MRKCFIHIGTHKTGTTSIQHLLSRESTALQQSGYLYPRAGRLELLSGHHNLAWEISGDHRFQSHYGTIEELIREVRPRPEDVILSSEDFECSLHQGPEFSRFISLLQACGYDVSVILYVRNQIDYLPRMYLTHLHAGLDVGFDHVLPRVLETAEFRWREWIINFDYCDLLRRINEIPNVNVIVRSYEQAKTSICSDFLSIFELNLQDLSVVDETFVNVSLPLRYYLVIFLQNTIGRKLLEYEQQAVINLALPAEDKIELSPAVRLALFERFRDTNRNLFMQYGIPEPKMENIDKRQDDNDTSYIDKLFSGNAAISQFLLELHRQLAEKDRQIRTKDLRIQEMNQCFSTMDQHIKARDLQFQEMETQLLVHLQSHSFRLGRALTWPLRSIKKLFR